MATTYDFIIKNSGTNKAKDKGTGGGNVKSTGKSTESLFSNFFGGEKGGVEANRKTRAVNPLLNRATSGWWEKGTRLGRAGLGIIQQDKKTGSLSISGVSVAILISFAIQQMMRIQREQRLEATKQNQNNFKSMEVGGDNAIGSAYKVSTNFWDGKVSYNQNK